MGLMSLISPHIKERDAVWAKAKETNNQLYWVHYRTLRNNCTKLISFIKFIKCKISAGPDNIEPYF